MSRHYATNTVASPVRRPAVAALLDRADLLGDAADAVTAL
jgi:hypothetical protein